MSRSFDVISEFVKQSFEVEGWETDDDGDRTIAFRLDDGDGREWDAGLLVDEDAERVLFYSTTLEMASPKHRAQVMELITRANFGLPSGNFELDLEDGEVCFKTSIELEGVELTPQMCTNLVGTNLVVMGTYFDALHDVMAGKVSAAEAIAAVEEDEDE